MQSSYWSKPWPPWHLMDDKIDAGPGWAVLQNFWFVSGRDLMKIIVLGMVSVEVPAVHFLPPGSSGMADEHHKGERL